MSFKDDFSKIAKSISEGASSAAKKSAELYEISKLNLSIQAEKRKIKELEEKIGHIIYKRYRDKGHGIGKANDKISDRDTGSASYTSGEGSTSERAGSNKDRDSRDRDNRNGRDNRDFRGSRDGRDRDESKYKITLDEKIIKLCKKIDEANDVIDSINKKIARVKNVRICSKCGIEMPASADHCPYCEDSQED
jgi:ribosomal protein L40E